MKVLFIDLSSKLKKLVDDYIGKGWGGGGDFLVEPTKQPTGGVIRVKASKSQEEILLSIAAA